MPPLILTVQPEADVRHGERKGGRVNPDGSMGHGLREISSCSSLTSRARLADNGRQEDDT